MSDDVVKLTLAGKENLFRVQRVLDRFQAETRCESPEVELLRQALKRYVEKHNAVATQEQDVHSNGGTV